MSGKPRHGRRKRVFHSNKGKNGRTLPAPQQQTTPSLSKPVISVMKRHASEDVGITTHHAHILIELRRIGIMAGIIIIILIVLAVLLN